ncbi:MULTISPECIES: histidine phosphatase family protein [unclassified Streptomyces]|uniref:histidine phosphatase family protein n=1 Tax=unclassified Streptomyces TaxID=2593676 RepID=UPI0022593BBB|nr:MULTISPECIES: histidine phosphatase family protein [unclassified Streptomyces]MCX5052721.1 histidine phosphatase family protein [Streptomyces sp. NBC_00474]MCX5250171.1 histidine phosphatase family protein [Streptomyces sp. NBC_00201]
MRLLLVRHGQTPSNVDFLLDTAVPGPGLTALGERQAAALPEALADEDIEALYASTLVRTQLTAMPLATARGLDVLVRDGIRELTAGDLEMLPGDTEQGALYMKTVFAWAAGDTALRMPGGESGAEALARYDAVVAEAAGSGAGTVAMVSHGAAIRMWTAARADNVDVAFAAARPLDNTGVVILEGSPADGWKALTWAGATVAASGDSGPAGRPVGEPA